MLRCAASSLHPRFMPLWAGQPLAYPTVQKTGAAALFVAGAGVNTKTNTLMTALMTASFNGHQASVEALISGGADVNAKDENGDTAVLHAMKYRSIDCVEVL